MTSKLRIEYVRPKRAGDGHDLDPDAIEQVLGYGGTLSVGATSQQAAAMPTFAADRGLTGGVYARLTCVAGAVIAAIGADPTAAEGVGIYIAAGDSILEPIEAGQKVAAIQAAVLGDIGRYDSNGDPLPYDIDSWANYVVRDASGNATSTVWTDGALSVVADAISVAGATTTYTQTYYRKADGSLLGQSRMVKS